MIGHLNIKKAGLASRNFVSNIPRCVCLAVVVDFSSLYFSFNVKLIPCPVRSSVQSSRIFVHSLAIYLVWRSGPEPRGFGTTEPEKLFPGLVSDRGLMADATIGVGGELGREDIRRSFLPKARSPNASSLGL